MKDITEPKKKRPASRGSKPASSEIECTDYRAPVTHNQPTTTPPQEQQIMSTQNSNEASRPAKQIHTVKMSQDYFPEYKKKHRNAQIRFNDRAYQDGDLMVIKEFSDLLRTHTGAEYICQITSISVPPGLLPGHILMHTRHLV